MKTRFGYFISLQRYLRVSVFFIIGLLLIVLPGCSATTPPQTQEPGGESSVYGVSVNILGAKDELLVNENWELKEGIQIASADNSISLSIAAGTQLLDKEGNPIKSIEVVVNQNSFPKPENAYIVGQVYDFKPDGATFNYPLKLNLKYFPNELQQGTNDAHIYVACYENNEWNMVRYKQLDVEKDLLTTKITHFCRYAIIAPKQEVKITPSKTTAPTVKVDLLYFHRPQRCTKCLCFERRVSYVVNEYFQDEIDSGQLTFQVLDIGDKENLALVKKYGAVGSQLFINTIINGEEHIKGVQEIWSWDCTSNTDRFDREIENIIELSLYGEQ